MSVSTLPVESLPTVREVLTTPALAGGRPTVLAAEAQLDRRVRWIHVSDLSDIAALLDGGELILTTGLGLPRDDTALDRYARDLAAANAAGLVIELGRRFDVTPAALIRACDSVGLPLVSLQHVVRFVDVTREVHSRILTEQLELLQASERAHRVFTQLGMQGASPNEIVAQVASVIDRPVIFENLLHHVLALDARRASADELLHTWDRRSHAVVGAHNTFHAPEAGFLVTQVAVRGQAFGRLIALVGHEASPLEVMVLERGATALTLNRLLEHNRTSMEQQAHKSSLVDLIEQRYTSRTDMMARLAALGLPTAGRDLIPVVVDSRGEPHGSAVHETTVEQMGAAARSARLSAIVAALRPGRVAVLLTVRGSRGRDTVLRAFAAAVHGRFGPEREVTVAAGPTVTDLDQVATAFSEAFQIGDAARGSRRSKPYFELRDIELRGLLYVLSGDTRVQGFVERSLGPLLRHDDRHGTELCRAVSAFLSHGGNKAAAAASSGISRQAFYRRIESAERILGVDLSSPETRTSLHAASLALESIRDQS